MKKSIIFILSLIFVLTDLYPKNHWIQKDKYLEINNYLDTLLWLKTSSDGKFLYSYTNHGYIKKYDAETGDTLKSWIYNLSKLQFSTFDLNPDEESYIAIYRDSQFSGYVYKYFLGSDSLIFTFTMPMTADYGNYFGSIREFGVKYFKDNKSFLLHSTDEGYSASVYMYKGIANIFDNKTGKLIIGNNESRGPYSAAVGNHSLFAYSWFYEIKFHQTPQSNTYGNSIFLDSGRKVQFSEGTRINEMSTNLSFSKNEELLLGMGNSLFHNWFVKTGKLKMSYKPSNDTNYNYNFNYLNWTNNNSIFLHSYFKTEKANPKNIISQINFYHKEFPNPVDSIVFNKDKQNYSICFAPDSTNFYTISEGNIIRCFKPDILSTMLKAYFQSDLQILLPGDTAKFFEGSIGNPKSWLWDFGDSITSSDQNPKHSWKNPGLYSIKLVISDGTKYDTLIKKDYIKINKKLMADFSADTLQGDYPFSVKFTNKSIGDIKKYFWDFNDGFTDSIANPNHTFKLPGVYNIKLVVFDGIYYDTIKKVDFINVKYKNVTDPNFEKEIIKRIKITDINGSRAFESKKNNYIIEGFNSTKSEIFGLDDTFNEAWNKIFFTNIMHKPLQKVRDTLFVSTGDSIYRIDNVKINKINNLGQVFLFQSSNGFNLKFDFYIDTTGLVETMVLDNNSNWPKMDIYILDNKDSMISHLNIYFSLGYYDHCTDIKIFKGPENSSIILVDRNYSLDNKTSKIEEFQYRFDSKGSYKVPYLLKIPSKNISNLMQITKSEFLCILNNNIYKLDTTSNIICSPSAKIMKMEPFSTGKYLLCGNKNGFCWYGIMNDSGKIYEEYIILERPGTFFSVSINKDSSLLFSGVVNKNISETYFYLFKTKPLISDIKQNEQISNDESISINPNPASDYIEINVGAHSNVSLPEDIEIFNIFGEKIPPRQTSSATTHTSTSSVTGNLRIDISNLAPGVYFIKIGNNFEKFVKM